MKTHREEEEEEEEEDVKGVYSKRLLIASMAGDFPACHETAVSRYCSGALPGVPDADDGESLAWTIDLMSLGSAWNKLE